VEAGACRDFSGVAGEQRRVPFGEVGDVAFGARAVEGDGLGGSVSLL
jgi:hypothetical protein